MKRSSSRSTADRAIQAPPGNRLTGRPGTFAAGAATRTDLAWVRSALAFGVVGAALLKSYAAIGRARPVDGFAALVLAVAIVALAGGYVLRRSSDGVSARRSLMLVSAGTVAIGLAAIVIGATSP